MEPEQQGSLQYGGCVVWLRVSQTGLSHAKVNEKGKRVGFPKFKSKNTTMRFAYSTGFTAPTAGDPYGLKLPRIGRVHCMENVYKLVNGAHLVRVSVSRRAGNWYASLTVEREQPRLPFVRRRAAWSVLTSA